MTDFEHFWARYPRKIARLLAQKCYAKARLKASAEEILAGVERYREHKPAWQEWAHPSSWLNSGRWMDEYEPRGEDRRSAPRDTPERRAYELWREHGCPHTPQCPHFAACQIVSARTKAS